MPEPAATHPAFWKDRPWTWLLGPNRRRRLWRHVKNAFDRRWFHHEMRAGRGAEVALWGCEVMGPHLAGVYLGEREGARMHHVPHGWDREAMCRRLTRRHGLVAVDGALLPPGLEEDAFRVPILAEMDLDLPASLEEFGRGLGSSAADDLRRVRRAGFTSDITSDPDDLRAFHEKFYVPLAQQRFQKESRTTNLKNLRKHGDDLLRIFAGGAWVGGVLCSATPEGYRVLTLGVEGGSNAVLRGGVGAALYWAAIERAYALGLRRMLWGGVRPYLSDGVMAYKAKWGAVLAPQHRNHRILRWRMEPDHPRVRSFLAEHPLIFLSAEGRPAVLSLKPPPRAGWMVRQLGSLVAWYRVCPEADRARAGTVEGLPNSWQPWCVREPLDGG